MEFIPTIINETRTIKFISSPVTDEGQGLYYEVGRVSSGLLIEQIVPYHENGEMSHVVWFAIFANNKIVSRVASKYIAEVGYDPSPEKSSCDQPS